MYNLFIFNFIKNQFHHGMNHCLKHMKMNLITHQKILTFHKSWNLIIVSIFSQNYFCRNDLVKKAILYPLYLMFNQYCLFLQNFCIAILMISLQKILHQEVNDENISLQSRRNCFTFLICRK